MAWLNHDNITNQFRFISLNDISEKLNDASRTSNPLQNNFLYSQNLFHYVASTISCDTNSTSKLALPLALESDQKWCNLNIMPTVLWPLDFRHVVNKWLVLTVLVIWLSWPFIDDTTSDLQIACTKKLKLRQNFKDHVLYGLSRQIL